MPVASFIHSSASSLVIFLPRWTKLFLLLFSSIKDLYSLSGSVPARFNVSNMLSVDQRLKSVSFDSRSPLTFFSLRKASQEVARFLSTLIQLITNDRAHSASCRWVLASNH